MMNKTIIAVFCYKRSSKLKVAIEALLLNPECAFMDVIFFCDGFKGEKDKQGVMETRRYINSLTGFRNIYTHFREKNLSTGPNFELGIRHLMDNYESFIVVEDDLVVTPNYIRYMLDALEFYRDVEKIFCISGFAFPLDKKDYPYDTVVHRRFCSYGWASWSDRVKNVVWSKEELSDLVKNSPGFKSRLDKEGRDLYRLVKKQINGDISTWDIQMQVHVAENSLNIIYPVLSKTHNIGFDQESTNTFGIDYLKTKTDCGKKRTFNFCHPGVVEPSLQRQLKRPYNLGNLITRKILNTLIQLATRFRPGAA